MYDLVSIGDTTYDVFVILEEASVHCTIDKEKCELCLSYADKIPYKEAIRVPAVGNSANNAVGAARLGLNVALYTFLGKDSIGKENLEVFKKEGVDTSLIQYDEQPSNYHIVLSYQAERTILVNHHPHDYDIPEFDTKWIYFSSLAEGHENIHKQLPEIVKEKGIKMGFNPGTFQMREGRNALKPILEVTEVLILNKQEAQELLENEEKDPKVLLDGLLKLGPKMTIVTDGDSGSFGTDGKKYYKLGIFETPVIERTGAGDAFSTGTVSAFAAGKDLAEAMRWGTFNSAFVVGKVGAQAGLLKKEEMEKSLSDNPDFRAKEI